MSQGRHVAARPPDGPRSRAAWTALAVCGALVFAGFVALGTWQVERRAWKLDLIARVEQRVHAPATEAPPAERWPALTAADDEYRRVRLTGTFLPDRDTLVQASTELGSGFWVLTPLRQADGSVVLVNRGFVPPERATAGSRVPAPAGELSVSGLLRMSEADGAFPRRNVAAADRWYSRELPAIARVRGLGVVAPYFVDADAVADSAAADGLPSATGQPVGGLTVVAFHNSHLVYAITWYALALMVALAAFFVVRDARRRPPSARQGENGGSTDAQERPDAAPD